LARQDVVSGWLRLGAEMVATVLGGLAIWWFTGITGSQRAIWKTRLAIMRGQASPVTR
jgi:hypothetical protein